MVPRAAIVVVALAASCGTVSTEIEKGGAGAFAPRPDDHPIVLSGAAASLVDAPSLKDAALRVCTSDGARASVEDAAARIDAQRGVFDGGPFRHVATLALSRPRGASDDGDGPFADAMRRTARELGGDVVAVRVMHRRGARIERVKADVYRLECEAAPAG